MRKITFILIVLLSILTVKTFAEDQIWIFANVSGDTFCLSHSEPPTGVQEYQSLYTNLDTDGTTYISGIIPDETNPSYCLLEILTITDEKTFTTRYKIAAGDVLKFYTKKEVSPHNYYIDYCYILIDGFSRNVIWMSLTDLNTYNRQFR